MTVKRTGAQSRGAIPPAVLEQLNAGTLETATLAEGLAIDFASLLARTVPEVGDQAVARIAALGGAGVTQRMAAVGRLLLEAHGLDGFDRLATHRADTVRGWAAYLIAAAPDLSLTDRLHRIRGIADDPHFGVREWAWLALRPHIAAAIDQAIELLAPWTAHPSANIRRFAVEATRPRGVWAAHIGPLKRQPDLGRPLLEPLKADPAPYVQDSVANWLNDAAKSQAEWVQVLCARWLRESASPATARICQRATRSLKGSRTLSST